MIKNIIFDLGNVLIAFKPQELMSKYTEDLNLINEFITTIISSDTWQSLDRGTISLEATKKIFLKEYPKYKDLITFFYNNWKGLFEPIQKNVKVLKKLSNTKYKKFALSNFPEKPFQFVKSQYDFFNLFDGLVISYKENFIKPEKEIYEILLKRFNLKAEECLFIDDTESFCFGAEKLGINTILLTENMKIQSEFEKYRIKI